LGNNFVIDNQGVNSYSNLVIALPSTVTLNLKRAYSFTSCQFNKPSNQPGLSRIPNDGLNESFCSKGEASAVIERFTSLAIPRSHFFLSLEIKIFVPVFPSRNKVGLSLVIMVIGTS